MVVSKSPKQHRYKIFHRKSLLGRFQSNHSLKYNAYRIEGKLKRKSRTRHIIKNLHQTYRSICSTGTFIFRLFIFIDKITRELFIFFEKIIRIITVIYGWICLIRSILSAIHLMTSRIMILSSKIYRICHLLSILFEPFSNRTFEKAAKSFSHFLFYYYSSNGACYTLQARTRHIVGRVRARWRKNPNYIGDDSDIYYDAFDEEYQWI